MADEAERLVVAPFREIVEKGKTATENAKEAGDDAAAMLKAAQNLVKEGERALKRIEPICAKNCEEYGANFVDAIKENDEINEYRSELEDLLWDFDDYIEVDEFDVDKFDELQKASRKAAPRIVDILKRMKLVAPALPSTSSEPSRAASTVPDTPTLQSAFEPVPAIKASNSRTTSTEKLMEETELQLSNMMGLDGKWKAQYPRSPLHDFDRSESRSSRAFDPPPRPPSTDPWQLDRVPPISPVEHLGDGDKWERRPPVPADSPTIPHAQPVSPQSELASPLKMSNVEEDRRWPLDDHDAYDQRMRAASQSHASDESRSPLQSHRWTNSTQGSTESTRPPTQGSRSHKGLTRPSRSPSHGNENPGWQVQIGHIPDLTNSSEASSAVGHPPIPKNAAFIARGQKPGNSLAPSAFPPRQSSTNQTTHFRSSRHPSTESVNSSVFDVVECVSPKNPAYRNVSQSTTASSTYSNKIPLPAYPGSPPIHQPPPVPSSRSSGSTTVRNQSSSTIATRPGTEATQPSRLVEEGLIPVDMENSIVNELPMPAREPDCSIGPFSSFYKLKGFCKGAEEAQKGQLGFKKIKRPVGGFSMALVAKCNHCLYELDYKAVESDLNNDPSGNFSSNGVAFRLRVLQKSHLQVRHVDEQMYGCVFCIQRGQVSEESDATVFFNQRQLFAHMARHSRPMPEVHGITVLEEAEKPREVKDNFDLHLPNPPVQSVMTGLSREVAALPAAVATDTRKPHNGILRTPPDRTPVLHFAVGARIVGIEFPAKYDGKWAIGWHDGVRAAFEIDAVQFEAPPKGEVKMQQGSSSMQAVARWKWNQKGDERWLKVDKGDTIKNITWSYTDHWCWSGTTSKGWGIFPQTHLDPNSVRSAQPGDAASISSWEKKGPLSFSLRKKPDRKLGSFDSTNVPSRTNIF
ncbi:hypothetical protein F5Y15DRAFT_395220 [Xylariaceae sp. FL0016]|nr:hypothetical protein F5Y15DRAFT_395220 [Xylariaceae sp. FL0016]